MIDKEEVLNLIEPIKSSCQCDSCKNIDNEIKNKILKAINKLPVYEINIKDGGDLVKMQVQNIKNVDRCFKDTELLKECDNAIDYLCFLDTYDRIKYNALSDKLKERLDIK